MTTTFDLSYHDIKFLKKSLLFLKFFGEIWFNWRKSACIRDFFTKVLALLLRPIHVQRVMKFNSKITKF